MSSKSRVVDGDSQFTGGMNSQTDPKQLTAGFYKSAMNMLNRGGVLQCRPGYDWRFNLACGDNLQGGILFTPLDGGLEAIIYAVDGQIYFSRYPFVETEHINGLSFRSDAVHVHFEVCEKAAERNADGSLKLVSPYKVVIIQDGFTAPGAWDGGTGRHLYDKTETKLGTRMKWSGDRLWVARGRELFASDIYDPISFTEGQYISNAKSFLLTREITALAEVTSSAGGQLVAFTDTSTSLFQSNIRDRTQWSTTDNFQRVLFPGIGCIAHKSVVTQHGLLWWYSQHGLVNFDAASASYVKSEFVYQDGEMAGSKGWLSGNLDGIAGAAFENYLLMSVPHADKYNTHTWVLDKSPVSNVNQVGTQAWNSYWTGTRPAVWVFGPIRGVNRIFQLSRDLDGTNRCWEAFGDERLDNGCPISWAAELRAYTNSNLNLKEFRWAELTFGELLGKVDIAVFWAGSARGAFKRISTKHIEAEEGVISEDRELGEEILFALKKQSRTLVTEDARAAPTETTTCQIESEKKEALDTAFQLLIVGSGPAALQAVRIFMEEQPDITSGKCEAQEDDKRSVRYDGSGFVLEADEALVDNSIVYTSNKTVQAQLLDEMFVGKGYAESKVSQGDADKIALSHAQNQVNIWLGQRTPYYVGNPDDPII